MSSVGVKKRYIILLFIVCWCDDSRALDRRVNRLRCLKTVFSSVGVRARELRAQILDALYSIDREAPKTRAQCDRAVLFYELYSDLCFQYVRERAHFMRLLKERPPAGPCEERLLREIRPIEDVNGPLLLEVHHALKNLLFVTGADQ